MDSQRLPNRELIDHLARAEPDDPLWKEFVSRFRPRVRLAVLRSLTTESDRNPGLDVGAPIDVIDDLTQEVFIRLVEGGRRALSRFQGRTDQSAYVYVSAIAANLVHDHFKTLRATKTPKSLSSLSSVVHPSEGDDGLTLAHALMSGESGAPERYVASTELRDKIREVVEGLSPRASTTARDRLVFQLYFIEGLTVDEIAANRSIRLSASGVEKRIRRIRDALKSRLSSVGGR